MPNFSYKAKSFAGDSSAGVLAAKDERELAQMLKAQGMILGILAFLLLNIEKHIE